MPARALFTSASLAETWLVGIHRRNRNIHSCRDCRRLRIFKIRLGAFIGNLIVRRIDLDQHCPRLNNLVVLDVQLDHVA